MTSRLYLGDCLEILKDLETGSVDAVITDPVWPNCPEGRLPGADGHQVELLRAALEMLSGAKRVVVILRADSDPRFLAAIPERWPFCRLQVLPYAVPGYLGRYLGGMEVAYCFGEPIPFGPGQHVIPGMAPAVTTPRARRAYNGHPCPRAIEHMRWLVRWWSEPGDVVVDPFMGSGSTGVACIELGLSFIGIEISEEYFKIAQKRIADAEQQLCLPLEVQP
jgi:site-specific DNA-methyltransferase (adenine-specific)